MAEFDLLRAAAVLLIVFCHWSATENCPVVGWCGASIGNSIFFAMSGLLLGLRWKGALGCEFIRKRFTRIFPVYWMFLLCFFGALYLSGNSISFSELTLNMCGMGWFGLARGGRHLWFITGIILFYLVLALSSQLLRSKLARSWRFWVCGFCVTVLLQYIIASTGWPQAYLLTFLFSGCFLFVSGDKFMRCVTSLPLRLSVCAGLGVCLVYYMLMRFELFKEPLFVNYWLAMCAAVVVMLAILRAGRGHRSIAVAYLSKYSFEIYLIHYPLCTPGPLCIRNIVRSDPWYTLCFVGATAFLAIVLHHSARYVICKIHVFEGNKRVLAGCAQDGTSIGNVG